MKKLFLQAVRAGFLLALLSRPAVTRCAYAIDQESTAHALPLPAMDQPSEPLVKGYSLKNMLQTIMNLYPGITIQKALLQSPLLAEMNRDWMLEAYGNFTVVLDTTPGKEDRLITIFSTETPLNQITRMLFNVTDGSIRPTEQPSNPFLGLNAQTIASMVKILHSQGIEGLIKTLQTQCEVEQKPTNPKGKGTPQPAASTPTDDMVKQWYDIYKLIPKSEKLTNFGRFKKAIRDQFIPQLAALNRQAITPEDNAKNIENLSKLFMTSLFLKDQNEGAANSDYSIPTYFKALGSDNFSGDHYTRAELKELDKLFKGEPAAISLEPHSEGIEKAAFYLEDKIYGGTKVLETPYRPFKSTPLTDPSHRFDGKEFTDCNESAIRSILNLAAYDPATGNLNPELLPRTIHPQLKLFLEHHNDPSISTYYQDSAKKWLPLVSGIQGVSYLQDAPQGKFEISGLPGPKNILKTLNYLLGTSAPSFEELGITLSSQDPDGRKISFLQSSAGYFMQVTDKTGIIAQGTLLSQENVTHGAFLIQNGGLYDLIASKNFVPLVQEINRSLDGTFDLFKICFTDKTLHSTRTQDQLPPLEFAAKNGLTDALKVMLQYETNPISYKKLLYTAIKRSGTIETVKYLLTFIKKPDYEVLLSIAAYEGNMEAFMLFLPQVPYPDYKKLLENSASSISGNTQLIEFLLTRVPNPDYDELLRLSASSGSLQLITFFLDKGGDLMKKNLFLGKTSLDTAILAYFMFFNHDHTIRRTDVENKPGCCEVIKFLIKNGGIVTKENVEDITSTGNLELTQLLLSLVSSPNYQQLLSQAVFAGSIDLVRFFVKEKGASVQAPDQNGITPLEKALQEYREPNASLSNFYSIIEFLIEKGAVVNQQNLENAIQTNNVELVTLLLLYLENPDYNQLLRRAIKSRSLGLITLFLDKGADINACNENGVSILDDALNNFLNSFDRNDSVIKLLVEKGAHVTQKNLETAMHSNNKELIRLLHSRLLTNPDYNTLLRAAIKKGDIDIITLFLDTGVDINARNEKGISLLDEALIPNLVSLINPSIIELLLQRGALVTQNNLQPIRSRNAEIITLLLQNAHREQLSQITPTQEQVCTTECVTETM
jgi:ankyrin repeat protein